MAWIYVTRETDLAKGEFMAVANDLGLDVLQMIPGAGSVVSAAKMGINATRVPALSIKALALRDGEQAFIEAGVRRRDEITSVINRLHVSGRKQSQLLDAAAALADIGAVRVRRA